MLMFRIRGLARIAVTTKMAGHSCCTLCGSCNASVFPMGPQQGISSVLDAPHTPGRVANEAPRPIRDRVL